MKKYIFLVLILILTLFVFATFVGCAQKSQLVATDGDGNDLDENKTYKMPENIVFSAPRKAVVNNLPLKTVTLKATLSPLTATIKTVTWSVAFANPSSSWASGKNVTSYISLIPNGLTCIVKYWKPFGEQILVSCVANDGSGKSATCKVDCLKAINNAYIELVRTDISNSKLTLNNTSSSTLGALVIPNKPYKINVVASSSAVGTVLSSYTVKCSKPCFVSNFYSMAGLMGYESDYHFSTDYNQYKVYTSININRVIIESMLAYDDYVYESEQEADYLDDCITQLKKIGTSKNVCRWHLVLVDNNTGTTVDKCFYFRLNTSYLS